MQSTFFQILNIIDSIYWSYIGFSLVMIAGLYFSFKTGFYQIRALAHLPRMVRALLEHAPQQSKGLSPFKLYFASIGGMVGIGNIVAVITGLMIGGPGSLFWLWIASFAGMLIKYSEVYVGMRYRVSNKYGSYNGGPMYYVQAAFKGPLGKGLAIFSALLLCIYGVEVYQFTVITDTLVQFFDWNREWVIGVILIFTLYIGIGGVRRMAALSSWLMPLFLILYIVLCSWVVLMHITQLPSLIVLVIKSAFVGQSAIGGFAGSTFLIAAQQGTSRAVYSADIAIGFDSIIQSESQLMDPYQQARLTILSTLTDTFICTLSMLTVLVTGIWTQAPDIAHSQYVATALSLYIPCANPLMVCIIFLAAFTTIQSYFVVGLKAANFVAPKSGAYIYILYAILSFWTFAHYDPTQVMLLMSLSAGCLILINVISIFRLRKSIKFEAFSNCS